MLNVGSRAHILWFNESVLELLKRGAGGRERGESEGERGIRKESDV